MRIRRQIPPSVTPVDMRGKVCVVTGASSGIGLETARQLLSFGARVIAIGRTPQRLHDALAALRQQHPEAEIDGEQADFACLDEVRALADRLRQRCPRIDVLVNNAGVWNKTRKASAQGHEHTFAVNHLAPFLLTLELAPSLYAAPRARVVNVSSRLHRKERCFDMADPHQRQRRYWGLGAYRQSKLANVMFTRELARRLDGVVSSNAVHPGDVATNVVRDSALLSWASRTLGRLHLLTPEEGARTSVFVATAPTLDGLSGRYFAYCRQRAPSPAAHDQPQAEALWRLSESLTATKLPAQ